MDKISKMILKAVEKMKAEVKNKKEEGDVQNESIVDPALDEVENS